MLELETNAAKAPHEESMDGDVIQVLACLPREPAAAVISEIACDIFRLDARASYAVRRKACGRVRRALCEIARHMRIYREYRLYDERGRSVPWGQRERYGIARADWPAAQGMIAASRNF